MSRSLVSLRDPTVLPSLVAAVVACALALAALAGVSLRAVSASGTLRNDTAVFGPRKTVDGLTLEVPTVDGHWLLPDATPGWVRYDFEGEHRLEAVSLLNTRDGYMRPLRSGTEVRVEVRGPDTRTFRAVLAPHPRWTRIDLQGARATSVVVHLDGHRGMGGGLNEVSFEGAPASFGRRFGRFGFAAVCAVLAALLARRVAWDARRATLVAAALALGLMGVVALRGLSSTSALEWCLVFDVRNLRNRGDIAVFFRDLRAPIPPVLALADIVFSRLTGTNALFVGALYKFSLVGAYLAALLLAWPGVVRMAFTALVGLVFIAATASVHPGNPQPYDVTYPLHALTALACLRFGERVPGGSAGRPALAGLAGLSLALLGLTRPFAFALVVPAAVLLGAVHFRGRGRERAVFLLALLPFVAWHGHQLSAHGQLTWSNHAGFNLANAWPQAPRVTVPPEAFEPSNSALHGEYSARLQRAVLGYIVTHPLEALAHLLDRLASLLTPQTVILRERQPPPAAWIALYVWTLRLTAALSVVAMLRRLWIFARRGVFDPLVDLHVWLTGGTLLLLAVGESAEDARFIFAVLPMFAVLPGTRLRWAFETVPEAEPTRTVRAATAQPSSPRASPGPARRDRARRLRRPG